MPTPALFPGVNDELVRLALLPYVTDYGFSGDPIVPGEVRFPPTDAGTGETVSDIPPAEIDMPAMDMGAAAAPANVSSSVSVGTRGFNPQTHDLLEQRARRPGGIKGELAGIQDQQAQELTAVAEGENRLAEQRKLDEQARAEAEKAKFDATAQYQRDLADLQTAQGHEEAKQAAQAQQRTAQYMADYETSLAEFRAARVDPNQLWGQMSGGQHFGMLASAFVHDFLGARGIHTSVLDTFNRAVDRNIQAQIENIRKGGQVAEGFKSLWDMSVAQSRTEAEARSRVRGFAIEAFKSQVSAELAGYDSQLAQAASQQALTAIDAEALKNKSDLVKLAQTNHNADKNAALDVYKTQVSASLESRRIAASEQAAALAAKGKAPEVQKTVVRDPETRQPVGAALSTEDAVKRQKEADDVYAFMRQMSSYLGQLQRVGSIYTGPGEDQIRGADAEALKAAHTQLITAFEKATGGVRAASSTGLMDRYKVMLAVPSKWTRESVEKAYATGSQLALHAQDDINAAMGSLRALSPEEIDAAGSGVKGHTFAPGLTTELGEFAKTRGKITLSPTQTLAGEVTAAPGKEVNWDVGRSPTPEQVQWLTYLSAHPEAAPGGGQGGLTAGLPNRVGEPRWAEVMTRVHETANNPYSPDQVSAQKTMNEWATGGGGLSHDQVLYAQYLLSATPTDVPVPNIPIVEEAR